MNPLSSSQMADAAFAELSQQGYCELCDAVAPQTIVALERDLDERFASTPFCQGAFYGAQTKRFGGLLKRSRHAEALVRHPVVLDLVERVLLPWCDRIQLNLTQAVEIHPGALAQFPHRDEDMWQGTKGQVEYLVNVMWPLTPFTADNGATRVWPGSHERRVSDTELDDALPVAALPGTAILFLGSTLHCGGANRTRLPRRGVIVSYCLGWLKPFENQWLVYPPGVARHFDRELAELIGYAQHRPNLGNYEGQCPSVLLHGELPDHLAAADALRPDQAAALGAFVADQRGHAGDA